MADEGIVIKDQATWDRIVSAVRYVEKLQFSPQTIAPVAPTFVPAPAQVAVRVTGAQYTSMDPPDYGEQPFGVTVQPVNGLWPGEFVYRNTTSESDPERIYTIGEDENQLCYVDTWNLGEFSLEENKVYVGRVVGARNGVPLVMLDLAGAGSGLTGCDGGGPAWVYGLLVTECMYLEVIDSKGTCFNVSPLQAGYMRYTGLGKWTFQEWNCETKAWVDKNFVTDADASPIKFWIEDGRPRLQISGIPYDLGYLCGGSKSIVFAGGTDKVCLGGGSGTPVQCANYFLVRLTCVCCPIDGWQGSGYYCVVNSDQDCDTDTKQAVLLTDPCVTGIKICSCRYDTLEAAEAVCPPPPGATCEEAPLFSKGVEYEGVLTEADQVDWYKFDGLAGHTYRVVRDFAIELGLSPGFAVYSGSCEPAAKLTDMLPPNFCYSWTQITDGPIYIGVHRSSVGTDPVNYGITVEEGTC